MYAKADWEKNTIIKDSVHGYINVPKPIAKEIVDTDVFQRLKNIEQTGMQVLYPSATHNRFVHSLGVYHLSKNAFRNFMSNVRTDSEDVYKSVGTRYTESGSKLVQGYEATWRRWELMFQLASLLHDSGHSPFSHTLEFIYDLVQEPRTLSDELKAMCSEQFRKDFDRQAERAEKSAIGKAHERMSALFVATEEASEKGGSELKGGFRNRIKKLIQSYMEAYEILDIYKKNDRIFSDDIEFMVRMIIGCHYELDSAGEYDGKGFHLRDAENAAAQDKEWEIELQVRNCIIGMLNSKLDVDNLDYVVRDSKYSGYASNNIDLERLLSSFTIINAYECSSPIQLNRDDVFDASINLNSFEGNYIDAKVSGACIISSQNKNLNVSGNIITETQTYSSSAQKKIFHTQDLFSAKIYLEDIDGLITIKPKTQRKNAYLNISGHLEGKLQGTILGDTVEYIKDRAGVKRRIYFAYKQNSMSVLMSAIEGSNFENKWVYAHHTTTFKNNYLTVYLLERYAEYLVDREVDDFLHDLEGFLQSSRAYVDMKPLSDGHTEEIKGKIKNFLEACLPDEDEGYKAIQKCLDDGLLGKGIDQIYVLLQLFRVLKLLEDRRTIDKVRLRQIIESVRKVLCCYESEKKVYDDGVQESFQDKIYKKYINLGTLEIQCFAKIMTMFTPNNIGGDYFYRTDDQDLLAKYKNLYQKLLASDREVQEKYQEFIIAYRHMITRTSMKCLWKSYPEYNFYFSDWTKEEIKGLRNLLHRASTPWGEDSGEKQKNYAILSDYVQLSSQAEKLWKKLKDDYALTRLVYVEQDIRTKAFVRYETYLKSEKRVVRLEDIRLYPDHQNNFEFFYIFYEGDPDGRGTKEFTPNNFLQEVRKLLQENEEEVLKEEAEIMKCDEKGTVIIRDSVHGDITFPPFFRALIDTKEFQRLRRIKQLATAGLVFPGAIHTRFSHSIGTYFIMTKLLNHFNEYFRRLNYSSQIDEKEENAILAAALLHDLGHGPYSHAFEKTELSMGNKDHAEWTISIIRDNGTEVHSVLENYEKGFSEKVAGYIQCEREVKNGGIREIAQLDDKLNLKFIFASLVSGQIDADRMDYLLRDARFSGVTCGQFDLEKVIEGLAISVENTGRYRVCIKEEYLAAAEEYFYARYQMHGNIYYHPYKMFSEELFRRILKEAQRAVLNGEISANTIPVAIANIFTQADISNDEYCKLDDTVVDGATHSWVESDVKVLAFLCQARINRKSYRRLEVLDYSRFQEDVEKLFGKNVWDQHFIICLTKYFKMYDKTKPVYILKKNGIIIDLEECSVLAKEETTVSHIYYSREMANDIYGIDKANLDKFEQLLEKNHIYSNIEIEKKYVFPKEKMSEVAAWFTGFQDNDKYEVKDYDKQEQIDIYYDTQDFELKKLDYTLRIREKADKYYITCKRPINSMSNGIKGQLERVEDEEVVKVNSLMDNRELIEMFLRDTPGSLNIFNDLGETVKIENIRTKMILARKGVTDKALAEKYEIAIDDVKYTNLHNNCIYQECQLEIELKSSYQNRINMKLLTDEIERNMAYLEAIDESKYQRALKYTISSGDGFAFMGKQVLIGKK